MEQHLLESGQVINTHEGSECFGQWCAIHHQMSGPWGQWPRYWRDDRGILERICPCGIGHPVAEMYDWAIAHGQGYELVHGCCGEHTCGPRVAKRAVERPGLPHEPWKLGVPDTDIISPPTRPGAEPTVQLTATDTELVVDSLRYVEKLSQLRFTLFLGAEDVARIKMLLSEIPNLIQRIYGGSR